MTGYGSTLGTNTGDTGTVGESTGHFEKTLGDISGTIGEATHGDATPDNVEGDDKSLSLNGTNSIWTKNGH